MLYLVKRIILINNGLVKYNNDIEKVCVHEINY